MECFLCCLLHLSESWFIALLWCSRNRFTTLFLCCRTSLKCPRIAFKLKMSQMCGLAHSLRPKKCVGQAKDSKSHKVCGTRQLGPRYVGLMRVKPKRDRPTHITTLILYVCASMCVCVCVCVYIYIYIYIYKKTMTSGYYPNTPT